MITQVHLSCRTIEVIDLNHIESPRHSSSPASVWNALDYQLICYPQGRFLRKFLPPFAQDYVHQGGIQNYPPHFKKGSCPLRRYPWVSYLPTFWTYSSMFRTTNQARHRNQAFHTSITHTNRIYRWPSPSMSTNVVSGITRPLFKQDHAKQGGIQNHHTYPLSSFFSTSNSLIILGFPYFTKYCLLGK